MAFESLSDKLAASFKKLRGKGRLTEADVKEAIREVRLAAGAGSSEATRSPVPTYLWGEPGSGKAHLLQAVRQALLGFSLGDG